MQTTHYAFKTILKAPHEEAVQRVTEELKKEGFGILTEIDVKATLKKKIDVDFRRYTILGACNPPNAYRALSAESDIGLMLPCNVVVYDGEAETSVVAAIDPVASMQSVENASLMPVAAEIQARLERVILALEK
jgi:uncharacterized protein (DUF302 family)